MALQGVAPAVGNSERELVVDMTAIGHHLAGHHRLVRGELLHALVIPGGVFAPAFMPALQHLQLGSQHQRLHLVQAAVHAHLVVHVDRLHAMDSEPANAVVKGFVVAHQGQTGISEGTEVFRRIETEGCHVAELPGVHAPAPGAHALAGVLDDRNAELGGGFADGGHVRHLAEQMHRQDGLGA